MVSLSIRSNQIIARSGTLVRVKGTCCSFCAIQRVLEALDGSYSYRLLFDLGTHSPLLILAMKVAVVSGWVSGFKMRGSGVVGVLV